jgi:hypothetical protein
MVLIWRHFFFLLNNWLKLLDLIQVLIVRSPIIQLLKYPLAALALPETTLRSSVRATRGKDTLLLLVILLLLLLMVYIHVLIVL